MGRIAAFLIDEIGNEYSRKNDYLKDLAALYTTLDRASKGEKNAIKKEIRKVKETKKSHPYIQKLNAYKEKEKDFLNTLKAEKKTFQSKLDQTLSNEIKKLKTKHFVAEKRSAFYKPYIDLTYDADFNYHEAKMETKHYPEMIHIISRKEDELMHAKTDKKAEAQSKDQAKEKADLSSYISERKETLKKESSKLKQKRKERVISEKALKNGLKELKVRNKKDIQLRKLKNPIDENKEEIRSLKHDLKMVPKRMKRTLNADLGDIRRKTPVETEDTKPYHAFMSFFLPGLGQSLNKQYVKAGLFLIASLFIYLVAIPYALGFGNYQGEGIAGLINLADGAPRIYRSLIFMIEGVIAVLLVLIAIGLLTISFKDVYNVQKGEIKGIRSKNWYETSTLIRQDGFPYMVSLPAFFITIFIVLVPVITTFLLSLTNMNPQNQSKFNWIGIDNYRRLALGEGLAGSVFWYILVWTIIWTIAATTLAILIGFFLAIIANNERIIGKRFFRTVYLLPWAVPAFITILFFSIMFSPNGALTDIISDIFGQRIVVKQDPLLTRITLIALQGWLGSAYVFLLSTGVLQAIPSDLYEAADIDGSTAWQKIRRITVPIVLFQTAPLLVTQYTFNFNNFSIIYLFNGGGPFNPSRYGNLAGSSDLLISYIYKLTMENQHQAIAATIIMFVSLGLMFFAFLGFKNSKAFKEEKL